MFHFYIMCNFEFNLMIVTYIVQSLDDLDILNLSLSERIQFLKAYWNILQLFEFQLFISPTLLFAFVFPSINLGKWPKAVRFAIPASNYLFSLNPKYHLGW